MVRFIEMPEGVLRVVMKDGSVYYNLKYKDKILVEE